PNGVPVARPRRTRSASRPQAVPLLVEPAGRLDRRHGHARPQVRSAPRARQPDRRHGRAVRARPRAGEAGAAIGVTAAEAFRVIVIDEDEAEDEAAAEETAETADTV